MGLNKTYKPEEDVCIKCGNWFPSNELKVEKHPILGRVKICSECSKSKSGIDLK